MLPVLCWRAEIWDTTNSRRTEKKVHAYSQPPIRAQSAKGTALRLPSISGLSGGSLAIVNDLAARSPDHLDRLGFRLGGSASHNSIPSQSHQADHGFPGALGIPQGFPGGSAGNESACNMGDLGSVPGLGRSPGEGDGYPLQYSSLENSMECVVHGVTESDRTEELSLSLGILLGTVPIPSRTLTRDLLNLELTKVSGALLFLLSTHIALWDCQTSLHLHDLETDLLSHRYSEV